MASLCNCWSNASAIRDATGYPMICTSCHSPFPLDAMPEVRVLISRAAEQASVSVLLAAVSVACVSHATVQSACVIGSVLAVTSAYAFVFGNRAPSWYINVLALSGIHHLFCLQIE